MYIKNGKSGVSMREIKFRAWDEQKKIMHYDFQFVRSGTDGNDWILFKSDKEDNVISKQNPYFAQQLKIMQYIGLKDKNGKEIYKDDIVMFDDSEINQNPVKELAEVIFTTDMTLADCPCFVLWFIGKKQGFYKSMLGDIEVIGNKYENPELEKQIK